MVDNNVMNVNEICSGNPAWVALMGIIHVAGFTEEETLSISSLEVLVSNLD
jgi:hypothetical protein